MSIKYLFYSGVAAGTTGTGIYINNSFTTVNNYAWDLVLAEEIYGGCKFLLTKGYMTPFGYTSSNIQYSPYINLSPKEAFPKYQSLLEDISSDSLIIETCKANKGSFVPIFFSNGKWKLGLKDLDGVLVGPYSGSRKNLLSEISNFSLGSAYSYLSLTTGYTLPKDPKRWTELSQKYTSSDPNREWMKYGSPENMRSICIKWLKQPYSKQIESSINSFCK